MNIQNNWSDLENKSILKNGEHILAIVQFCTSSGFWWEDTLVENYYSALSSVDFDTREDAKYFVELRLTGKKNPDQVTGA